jgi:hypothetical protein
MGSRTGMCTTKEEKRQLLPLGSPGRAKRKRREEKISVGLEFGGDDIAAGRQLGSSWHACKDAAEGGEQG